MRAGANGLRGDAVDRDGALRQLRHRGDDVGPAAGPRLHRPRPRSSSSKAATTATPTALLVQAGSGVATLGAARQRRRAGSLRRRDAGRALQRPRRAEDVFASTAAKSPPSSSSRSRPTWASSRPRDGFLEGLRDALRRQRRAADLRRGDDRLPRRPRRLPGRSAASRPTSPASARSSAAACPSAPTAAARDIMADGRAAAGPSTRPARSPATRWPWPPASPR